MAYIERQHATPHAHMVAVLYELRDTLPSASDTDIEVLASTLIERLKPIIDEQIKSAFKVYIAQSFGVQAR